MTQTRRDKLGGNFIAFICIRENGVYNVYITQTI